MSTERNRSSNAGSRSLKLSAGSSLKHRTSKKGDLRAAGMRKTNGGCSEKAADASSKHLQSDDVQDLCRGTRRVFRAGVSETGRRPYPAGSRTGGSGDGQRVLPRDPPSAPRADPMGYRGQG